AEDGIRDSHVTEVQTSALPISMNENPTIDASQTGPIGMSFSQQPIIPVYDIAGNYAGPAGIGSGNNPVAQMHRTRNNRFFVNRRSEERRVRNDRMAWGLARALA